MKKILIGLLAVVVLVVSCKKDEDSAESGTSQLWMKVAESVPDFTLTLKSAGLKNERDYTVTYVAKTLTPVLKTVEIGSGGKCETWVQVYKAYDFSTKITLQLASGKVYETRGFKLKEKRLIEVVSATNGTLGVLDRDISLIEKTIWVD